MSLLNDIDLALNGIQNILNFIVKVDPNAATNPIFLDLQKAIVTLKALGA